MGLLDDLEKEAERLREEEARKAQEAARLEEVWKARIEPAMAELETYLKRLSDHLKVLGRRMRATFEVPGYGPVVAYIEPPFVIHGQSAPRQIELQVEMVGQVASEECPLVVAETMTRARALASALQQHGLGGMFDARKNANGDVTAAKFRARGKIPMRLVVSADRSTCTVRFGFHNMEGFGPSSRQFSAEQFGEELFDALGRFLTREDSGFARENIPEDVRRQLQSKVQRDQALREWEARLAEQLAADEARVLRSLDRFLRPSWLDGLRRRVRRQPADRSAGQAGE
ncbi:MAG: hypothetical protein KatS3mg126_1682 [Lysobacteraceae bacterium]|nr:MAG: hypothetical protein KatS3mg126_1682 [Xanthomonadaceae bacterium]